MWTEQTFWGRWAGKQSAKGVNTGAPEAKEDGEGGGHCWGGVETV